MRKQHSEKQSEEIDPSTGLAVLNDNIQDSVEFKKVDAVHLLHPILTETTLLRLSL